MRADDLRAAVEEGLVLHAPVEPIGITADAQGFAKGVSCQPLELNEKEGKLSFVPSGEQIFIDAQSVILSHGLKPNAFLKDHAAQLKWNSNGTIWTDAQTGMTSVEKIFAAGNVVTGAGVVVGAIASGKEAAHKIIEFLRK